MPNSSVLAQPQPRPFPAGWLRWHWSRFSPHPFSLRYSLGLWFGSMLALYLAFLFQFETPQWAGVSVWIMFMQRPRLNYSKVAFWMTGTMSGAIVATVLIIGFSQMPEILLLTLSIWLALCAALATQLREYRAYGAVLAGYTAAIVAFSAVAHPENIFNIALTRVSCVALGVACAAFAMTIFLPLHRHWLQTLHHLNEHFRAILHQAALALGQASDRSALFSWDHVVERLSTVEHTFDITLAETADSRARAGQARCLAATLFRLAAQALATNFHLSQARDSHSKPIRGLQQRTSELLKRCPASDNLFEEIAAVRTEIERSRSISDSAADRFLLDQLDHTLRDLDLVLRDRAGLSGPWTAPRSVRLSRHRDGLMAGLYAARIFLAMGLGAAFWFTSAWPSGPSFLLFLAVVCSLLSLLDHAEKLGRPFVKSVVACFIASFIELFVILQKGEGFLYLTVAFGLFLAPAAYAYTHPRLAGSAVISMLLFYGLVSPANAMTYDIILFLNNGLAFLAAAIFGFFAFHVISSPSPATRRRMLLKGLRRDLVRLADWRSRRDENSWTSLTFDRLRLFHRFAPETKTEQAEAQENELHLGLLWGLRQIALRRFLENHPSDATANGAVRALLESSANFLRRPAALGACLKQAQTILEALPASHPALLGVLGDIEEMSRLLRFREVSA